MWRDTVISLKTQTSHHLICNVLRKSRGHLIGDLCVTYLGPTNNNVLFEFVWKHSPQNMTMDMQLFTNNYWLWQWFRLVKVMKKYSSYHWLILDAYYGWLQPSALCTQLFWNINYCVIILENISECHLWKRVIMINR